MIRRSSFGPRFEFLRFGLDFFVIWYNALGLLAQGKKVPRPGVGPGRLVKSPACKAGLSTNSSTGA